MPIFRMGSEVGGKEAGNALRFISTAINNVFFFNDNAANYFNNIKFFVIALRVSGKTKDFRSEGPECFQKPINKEFYTIDLTVPENKWKGVSFDELKNYLLAGIVQCFDICVYEARKSGELKNESELRANFDSGLQRIKEADQYDDLFTKSDGVKILHKMISETEKLSKPVDKNAIMKKIEYGDFSVH